MSDDTTAPPSRARLPLGVAGSWYDDEPVTDEQLAGLNASVEDGELPSYSRFVVRKLLREVERRRSLEDSYIVALDQCSVGDLQQAVAERDEARAKADAAMAELAAKVGEADRLRDELAEAHASHNPLLRCILVKAAPDRDLYIGWSNNVEAPTGIWTRAEALNYGFPRSRLDRADRNGTSSMVPGSGQWDDDGFIAEQRGWLRRDRLADYAQAYAREDYEAAWDLLEPFEDETEVRRG